VSKTFLIVNGDVVIGPGGLQMIADGPKVRQDLGEMLSVATQNDGFGAGIVNLVGTTFGSDNGLYQNVESVLRDRLTSASQRFMALQRKNYSNRPTTEIVRSIENIEVAQATDDPTAYFWRIDYLTLDGQARNLQGRVSG
jgi:hypothetical protein